MKCINCPYLVKRENISRISRIMGYTAECSQTGILFILEDYNEAPAWCPLNGSPYDMS
ncbi:MAG: hypothetical protein N2489_01960 [Clostridia bacterium]|nr:hypothetical protein [Clostridia bacterium]